VHRGRKIASVIATELLRSNFLEIAVMSFGLRFNLTTLAVRGLKIAAMFCVLSLVLVSNRATAESLNIQADTTWRGIGPVGDQTGGNINTKGLAWEATHLGWNTSLGFNDSNAAGWTNIISVVHPQVPFIRFWVDGTDTIGSSPAYFRKEFLIEGTPTLGLLDFGVDDDAYVYVNGTQVFADSNGLYTSIDNINVSAFLVPGPNLIAIKAHDVQGAQSINLNLDVTFTPGPFPVPEPSGIMLFLSGAVFVGVGMAKKLRQRGTSRGQAKA
jgi:hypothetical protein